MADIEAKCMERGCGATFIVSDAEQRFFAEKGYTLPKRCKTCRERRRTEKGPQASRPEVLAAPAVFAPEPEQRRREGRRPRKDHERRRGYDEF